ncbi:glutamate--tRNA ligase [archaeon]|nr:glutamate--tRNA ligase [archaeon]NCP79115.1 glutamate--tRNA ligase [archaeon]NCP98564.1 glutamate--tRNA ligase [archaeon]NCQ06882.1 glutamate--tRNA ligase [archaeon]NCQ50678.1 glutamate--tRNA ligase [archaeon]
MQETFKKIILENAVKYKGKAEIKYILGAILKDFPEYRQKTKELSLELIPLIEEINSLSLEKQQEMLKEINPSFFEKKEKEERNIFAFLNIKEGDVVKSAFPPGPEKYFHIGHAKAVLLNYLLAKKYSGKFQLRFEDTNPRLVRSEFYEISQDDFKWLGIEWDELVFASDYIDMMKEMAEKLILKSQAYVCFCTPEEMSKNRETSTPCNCRKVSPQENLIKWKEMDGYEEGKASLRLKIDLKHKNSRMRDPTIFRIIDCEHPRIGYKHRNYPAYDFQNAVLDGYFNITHRLRTVEFEMASELHQYIRKILGLHNTVTYEFSRMNLEGMLSSGRAIREKVNSGELIGWDDPSLPTLRALKRRGFTPEAIKQMVVESGITKSAGSVLTWDTLIKYNKKVLNDSAKRFFAIKNPVEITVENDVCKEYSLSLHPSLNLGQRNFTSNGVYLIENEDFDSFKEGNLVRLMDNINFRVKDGSFVFDSEDYLSFKNEENENKKIIHFLPKDPSQLIDVTIFTPEHELINAKAEKTIEQISVGDIIQFERFCFARLDSIEEKEGKKVYNFWFTH